MREGFTGWSETGEETIYLMTGIISVPGKGDNMERYHLIRHAPGGSDVYDSSGKQVGYSLPSVLGDGEDFYDMEGNPVGQSFDSCFGGEGFTGVGNSSYGFMDEEILMGRNAWLDGNPFEKRDEPLFPEAGSFGSEFDDFGGEDNL